jgi:hypothetical protein
MFNKIIKEKNTSANAKYSLHGFLDQVNFEKSENKEFHNRRTCGLAKVDINKYN